MEAEPTDVMKEAGLPALSFSSLQEKEKAQPYS